MSEDQGNIDLRLLRSQLARSKADSDAALKHGGGGGTFGTMDIVDAKIAAAEARTDTKFAELRGDFASMRGDFAVLRTELQGIRDSTSGIKATVVTTGIATAVAIVGLMIAVVAYGGQMFGVGIDSQTIAEKAATTVEERSAGRFTTMDARYDRIEQQMTQVLEAVRGNEVP